MVSESDRRRVVDSKLAFRARDSVSSSEYWRRWELRDWVRELLVDERLEIVEERSEILRRDW